MVREGEQAPAFTLHDKEGRPVSLADFHGRSVVLYFYPKDDTPGCTVEACSFRDGYDRIEGLDAVVLGVSPDDEASHRRFATKYGLPFTLLSDPDHAVAEGRPFKALGLIALAAALLRELSGEAELDRARTAAAACDCARDAHPAGRCVPQVDLLGSRPRQTPAQPKSATPEYANSSRTSDGASRSANGSSKSATGRSATAA